ncbi:hypothetical protein JQ616_34570 [Bradyrhizobium tropiciagri]|uniref:hypothetical protein n=1 Tax=Bradyrhizobium tropiciagri TaxID=312253 RepID=UPI001BAADB2A|nr:hypothetical protein [Bradyrhizobium tropiciagri]MBR0900103.1 hypothetical protein [Bradyrhizobium tropiciagri]
MILAARSNRAPHLATGTTEEFHNWRFRDYLPQMCCSDAIAKEVAANVGGI